jgi:hypothetical protein
MWHPYCYIYITKIYHYDNRYNYRLGYVFCVPGRFCYDDHKKYG